MSIPQLSTPFGTIRESIQQEPPLRTSANFDVFPESYHQFEQFNIDNQASNLIQKYPYMDSTVWNISTSEHLLAPNNNARIFGGNFPIELNATEETTSFASSLAQDMFSLQLPVQTLEESPSLEDEFLFNKSMPQMSFGPVQPEVASIDTEPLDWNWQGVIKPDNHSSLACPSNILAGEATSLQKSGQQNSSSEVPQIQRWMRKKDS